MLMAVLLDWMPSRYDGLIVYSALAFVMAPGLFLSGLFVTALPGILIGAFTVRNISGPSLGHKHFSGAFVGTFIDIIICAMRWWPVFDQQGCRKWGFLSALIFQTLLPIWLIAIATSKAINSKMEPR